MNPRSGQRTAPASPRLVPSAGARIAYLAHDLADPAVLRRVRMLHRAGATVKVLGFHRSPTAPADLDGAEVVGLGQSFNGRLAQRALLTLRQILSVPRMGPWIKGADVVLARNLEMLAIAAPARAMHARDARLVYECLDIHRLMTSRGWGGRVLRALEQILMRRAQLLIVSSPAFLRDYFEPWQGLHARLDLPVLTLENKVFAATAPMLAPRSPGPPWRIGWFGVLRCRRSLELLRQLAWREHGAVEVVLAGRPSEREVPDFHRAVALTPGLKFVGGYAAEDLERLYRTVHFSWTIDYFQEGANSEWLLPNRLYESGRFAAVPIALKGSETGAWLERRRLGLVIGDPARDLGPYFAGLDAVAYAALEARIRRAPRGWFQAGAADCAELLQALAEAA